MTHHCSRLRGLALLLACGLLLSAGLAGAQPRQDFEKRWLFVWRDMSDPNEVDRMIARFPAAHAAGYNGVAFSFE